MDEAGGKARHEAEAGSLKNQAEIHQFDSFSLPATINNNHRQRSQHPLHQRFHAYRIE